MERPRADGVGQRIARADVMLGGSDVPLILQRPDIIQASTDAGWLDRQADLHLARGQHLIAERLAWRAEALRAGMA